MFGTVMWTLGAVVMAAVLWRTGMGTLRSLTRPLPSPPPEGEMRRISLRYRCSICHAEARMTLAAEEIPDPPRHCQEDMDLVAPIE